MGHIKRSHLGETWLALPRSEVLDAASTMIQPLFLKVHANWQESFALAETRDALLPKLLSGEIRVNSEVSLDCAETAR
jgi:type I restriction enzyme S subunit